MVVRWWEGRGGGDFVLTNKPGGTGLLVLADRPGSVGVGTRASE